MLSIGTTSGACNIIACHFSKCYILRNLKGWGARRVVNQGNLLDKEVGKGVPGFSSRLNYLFDLAGAPRDTRLSWGSAKWGCVANTIGNWIKKDAPPQRFTTLQTVVNDLLDEIPEKYDANQIIGWLYTGANSPFEANEPRQPYPQIDHVLQVKIFNRLYQLCLFYDIDLDKVDSAETNRAISTLYWYLQSRIAAGLDGDVKEATPIMKVIAEGMKQRQ